MRRTYVKDLGTLALFLAFGGLFLAAGVTQLSTVLLRSGSLWGNDDAAAYFSAKDVEFALGLASGTIGLGVLLWLAVSMVLSVVSVVATQSGMPGVARATSSCSPRFMRSLVGLVLGASVLAAPGAFADQAQQTVDVPSPAFVSHSLTIEATPSPSPTASASPTAPSSPTTPSVAAESSASKKPQSSHEKKERETMHGVPAQHLSSVMAAGQRQSTEGHREVTVTSGDSLWSIVARHLGPNASNTEIRAEWPKWYERNKDRIGQDPDLIIPGTVLINPNF